MMDWHAAQVSLTLAVLTAGLLLPVGLWLARWLATTHWAGRPLVEALLLLPLLLPPTVIGFYFLLLLGQGSAFGAWLAVVLGAALCAAEVWLSGRMETRTLLLAWAGSLLGVHALIGLAEGAITVLVVAYVARTGQVVGLIREEAAP